MDCCWLRLAIAFAIVVLVALLIGVGLTRKSPTPWRTYTEQRSTLIAATSRHRIDVEAKDQLAALQVSFNSMTTNLEKLIVEQKEKERLQSELGNRA